MKSGSIRIHPQPGPSDIPWRKTGRRWDVIVDNDKMIEVKGEKGDLDQVVDPRFGREFKNDMLRYLFYIDPPPSDFEWVVKTEGGAARYKEKIVQLLGNADGRDVIGSMDSGLKEVLSFMKIRDAARYEEAVLRLKDIREKLDDDILVMTAVSR